MSHSLSQSHPSSSTSDPESPPVSLVLLLAAQHVLVLYCGILLVPVMLIKIYHFPMQEGFQFLFVTTVFSALATLMQVLRFKNFGLGRPMFMGTSGPFLACSHMALDLGGLALLTNLVLLSAPFQFLFGYCLRFMRHIITPTVGGVIIMLAITGLFKDSITVWSANPDIIGSRAYIDIAVGAVTATGMVLSEWMLGKRFRHWGLVWGLASGYLLALFFGLVDLSPLASAAWIGIPHKIGHDFVFQNKPEYWMLYFTFIVAMWVSAIKYSGDVMALQKVQHPNNRKVDYDGIQGGLYAGAFSATLTGLAGGLPATSHSPNIPVMELTGVVSRNVALASSILLLIIAASPKAAMALMCIPSPVIGAVGIVLVGHLFSTGMRLVADGKLNHRNGLIAGLSICAGLMIESDLFFPKAFPDFLTPLTTNGFAVGGLVAVSLTILSRLLEESGISFNVKPELSSLEEIKSALENACQKFSLEKNAEFRLVLACEEVFVHMVEEFSRDSFSGNILFQVRGNDNRVDIDVRGGKRIKDVDSIDDTELKNLHKLNDVQLRNLGLALFCRLAENIKHFHISDFTYISFSIPKNG